MSNFSLQYIFMHIIINKKNFFLYIKYLYIIVYNIYIVALCN